jgi:tetratricopeptide (TPR) repeat protein
MVNDLSEKSTQENGSSQRLRIQPQGKSQSLALAYEAYQQGNWAEARTHYQALLDQDPASLLAQMGLAAIHVKEGDYSEAMQRYQRILKKHPGHEKALAAQSALAAVLARDPAQLRQLKEWAKKWPDQAQIQAALGQYYAGQQDWPTAQSYFFKAYELAPDKVSYAHNLAVSLDQLGKYALAAQYYQQTLARSSSALTSSQKTQIQARLNVLNQFLSKES